MQYKNFITSPYESSRSTSKKYSYYKNGVNVKFPKKGPPLKIQILPAYDPQRPADPQGCVQCLSDGQPTAWFGMIQAAKFVGHGDWKSTLPFLSLQSFEGKEPCPYLRMLDYCKSSPDWKYLVTKTGKFGAPDYKDAILKPVKSILLMNIVDVDNPGSGVHIGEFSYSIANALLNTESGLVFQRNLQLENYPDIDAALAQNPMLAYANGDITDPGKAPVFVVDLPPVTPGRFGAGYSIHIEVINNRIRTRAASDVELAERYHLDDPESFLNIPTGQDIVDNLVSLLKGHKNANGVDETCAIKEALGDSYRIDTVSAPGAVNTVQGFRLPPEEISAPITTAQVPHTPRVARVVHMQPTAPQTTPAGFAQNPASVHAAVAAAASSAQSAATTAQTMAIPGETSPDSEAALAAVLAERMRTQLNLRKQ